jgi:hypothetical protein
MVVRRECCLCWQVVVSATGWSLVQRSTTDCGASLCVISETRMRRLKLMKGCKCRIEKNYNKVTTIQYFTVYYADLLVGVSTLSWWGGLSMPETLRAIPAVA